MRSARERAERRCEAPDEWGLFCCRVSADRGRGRGRGEKAREEKRIFVWGKPGSTAGHAF